ncbi:4222_t:CDS:2 [Racocetra fulgida]|uniref:4222_t:CDS:1 n=1 Tax=Racocetra fulgida TaxID=60492 RepID=A0A9N8WIX7_9GLOM|nr:4222_t:CDS:2 [Racocetra fulgida]
MLILFHTEMLYVQLCAIINIFKLDSLLKIKTSTHVVNGSEI